MSEQSSARIAASTVPSPPIPARGPSSRRRMRVGVRVAAAACTALLAGSPALAQAEPPVPEPVPLGTMSDLMIKLMYPASDAILYVESRAPTNEVEWNELQAQALILAESANLIMMPSRVVGDRDEWMRDARLMFDAGAAAYEAALEHDLDALIALNEQVYLSCVVCHRRTRPDYGRDYKRFDDEPAEEPRVP